MREPQRGGDAAANLPFYTVDFACSDQERLQQELNELYRYGTDLETKVAHRGRLNLFYLLMQDLQNGRLASKPKRAIDIGCGAGAFSRIMSDLGAVRVLGVDVSEDSVRRARARFSFNQDGKGVEFHVQRAEDLAGREMFDFLLCTEVIEHVDNPDRLVGLIPELLVPGGVAVVSLPNAMSIPYFALFLYRRVRRRPVAPDLAAHFRYPSYRSRRLFHGHAVRVVKTSGANLFLSGPLLRMLHPTSCFPAINRLDFALSRRWPFKYFAQFFFLVLQKEPAAPTR